MRSEFEKYFSGLCESLNIHYSLIYLEDKDRYFNSNTHVAYTSWQHRQTEVDDLQLKIKRLIESEENIARGCEGWRNAHRKADEKVDELQKRVDDALKLIPSIKAENNLHGCDQGDRQIELLEQALKGEG